MVKVMTTASATIKQVADISCMYCGEKHLFDNCLGNPASVNYVGNFNYRTRTIHILILTTLDGSNTQTFHGATRISML